MVSWKLRRKSWEIIRDIRLSAKERLGYYELEKHKPWLDDACSKSLHQRKQPNCIGNRIQVK
jgi:hypothetical protein